MTEQERCPHCDAKTLVRGEVLGDQNSILFSPGNARLFRSVYGVALASRAVACLSCGHVWTRLDPARLRDFIQNHTGEIGRQHLDELERGPYRDLPANELAREVGDHVSEFDALARDGNTGKIARRYRELMGVTWDQAIRETANWADKKRSDKLAILGWAPKKKESFDDLF